MSNFAHRQSKIKKKSNIKILKSQYEVFINNFLIIVEKGLSFLEILLKIIQEKPITTLIIGFLIFVRLYTLFLSRIFKNIGTEEFPVKTNGIEYYQTNSGLLIEDSFIKMDKCKNIRESILKEILFTGGSYFCNKEFIAYRTTNSYLGDEYLIYIKENDKFTHTKKVFNLYLGKSKRMKYYSKKYGGGIVKIGNPNLFYYKKLSDNFYIFSDMVERKEGRIRSTAQDN